MTTDNLDHRFNYHQPSSQGIVSQHANTRDRCLKLAQYVDSVIPNSREKSLAITHIEEAMFWTNAGIARINNYGRRPVHDVPLGEYRNVPEAE